LVGVVGWGDSICIAKYAKKIDRGQTYLFKKVLFYLFLHIKIRKIKDKTEKKKRIVFTVI